MGRSEIFPWRLRAWAARWAHCHINGTSLTTPQSNIEASVIPAGHRKGGPHRRDTIFVDAGRLQKVLAGKRSLRSIEKRNQKRVFALGQCDRDSAGISEAP
jgi:hypothetical protein